MRRLEEMERRQGADKGKMSLGGAGIDEGRGGTLLRERE